MTTTLVEKVERANHEYEIRHDSTDGLLKVYASPCWTPEPEFVKIGQTQTLAGARLIRRNHARRIEREY